ncbi:hypothetical protein [Desulfocurvibacter africanus]|uniref:Uncharacterized protein n=1 Tax=Desulfocurvibacter africanus subsp. africanus str. Walvis Bay TaxID=690850 RepID=F3YW31_DESAF|nr:hypothetical protein [Desulfocurvibacter africanus]EGJ49061.1 hypothetical protein Desaf_0709 [Desulfocurvibacter africanus subsp. africanus str. Walvis Bay]
MQRTYYSPDTRGFYLEGLHAIPANAVEITVEEHRALLAAQAQGKTIQPDQDGRPVAVEPPAPGMEAVIAAKRAEIRDAADAALADLMAEYGVAERASWDQQAAEADALAADAGASTPLLSAIAMARGMDVATLAQRVRDNRVSWIARSGQVIGQRLAYQDALDAAKALAETNPEQARADIAAIVPAYTVPEV